ncbi:hypothetical protein SAMN04487980_100922 [Streptomyces sp. cf124]|nr:hypothetical protein SAMN04487980_100922 [Streptomyces sp. cf124]
MKLFGRPDASRHQKAAEAYKSIQDRYKRQARTTNSWRASGTMSGTCN